MLPERTLGKYRLVRRVGVGGMAEVYEAVLEGSAGFARRVALKVLLPESQRDPDVVTMFIDEAKLVARLDHPNIVGVLDFGEAGGKHYMAMEFIDGWDLGHLLQLAARAGRRFSVDGAAFVVRELCRGLDHVHRAEEQVVHRDVTPQNVFVTRRGQVKLGDFGIARSAGRLTRTEDGRIKGKLPYLAPEQVAGDPVSPRTDVYAAGLILFELLSGRRLITAERDVELLQAALHPPAVDLSERPEAAAVEPALRQALEHHPTMRQASAGVLAADLEAHLCTFDAAALAEEVAALTVDQPAPGSTGPELAVAEQRPPHTRVMEPTPRRRASPPWGIVAALLLVAVAAGAVGLAVGLRGGDAPRPEPDGAPPDIAMTLAEVGVPDSPAPGPDASPPDAARDLLRRRPAQRTPRLARDAALKPDVARLRPDAAPDRAAIRGELERLSRLGRSRGLFPGDDPAADRLAARAGQGEPGALAGLRARVEAFRIDRAFVRAKMARLERAIAAVRLSADEQRRMAAVSQRILYLIMEEQLVEASRLMSATRAQLRSR